MEPIPKKYIVDEQGHRVAVQVDIAIFEKMEDLLENYALFELMKEGQPDDLLNLKDAKAYYATLPKAE